MKHRDCFLIFKFFLKFHHSVQIKVSTKSTLFSLSKLYVKITWSWNILLRNFILTESVLALRWYIWSWSCIYGWLDWRTHSWKIVTKWWSSWKNLTCWKIRFYFDWRKLILYFCWNISPTSRHRIYNLLIIACRHILHWNLKQIVFRAVLFK